MTATMRRWTLVAPNGDYASFCTAWVDARNRYANYEPVGPAL